MQGQTMFGHPKLYLGCFYGIIVLMWHSSPTSHNPTHIFEDACQKFRESLTTSQLELFEHSPDSQSMLKSINQCVETHHVQRNILTRCCRKIEKVANRLSPFMRSIDLIVSSHPEFAAIAWGSLSLVFTVSLFNHAICFY